MAKCVSSLVDWAPQPIVRDEETFVIENMGHGEELLRKHFEFFKEKIYDTAHDFLVIARSRDGSEKFDCSQVQDTLVAKLRYIYSETSSIVGEIVRSKLPAHTRHRYFVVYTCGVVEKIQQLCHIVGRLSELDRSIYLEEQHKPFISEESVAIHALTLVWSSSIEILSSLAAPAQEIFKGYKESQEFSFLDSLEFATAGHQQAQLFLVDLTVTSWIQFNRFTKCEDLLGGLPFLCYCHNRLYLQVLHRATRGGADLKILPDLLIALRDGDRFQGGRYYKTKHYSPSPLGNWRNDSDEALVNYFIVWHLVSLHKITNDDTYRPLIEACGQLLMQSCASAIGQFLPAQNQPSMSPLQVERFKLLLALLNYWCEKSSDPAPYAVMMLSFFDTNWNVFGDDFDRSTLCVNGMTVFQLFTKLVNAIIPYYTATGQAASIEDKLDTADKRDLHNVWNRLLARIKPKETVTPVST